MFNRLFELFKIQRQPSLQGFPLLELPSELITEELALSTCELSRLIVSRQTYALFQPSIRMKGAIKLINAMLKLDYDEAFKIVNSDPEIIFTTLKVKFNKITIAMCPLQFAASEYNVRMLKIFLFAIEDNVPVKKEKFLEQLLHHKIYIQLDTLWEQYAGFKKTFQFWLNRLRTDTQFNEAAAEFGRAQITFLPSHFLAEMCHHYPETDEWRPESFFNIYPAPHNLCTSDVTQHQISHWQFLGIVGSSSRHGRITLVPDDVNQINCFLLRGRNSDEAMHDGQLAGLMAIHARSALSFPVTLELACAPQWLIEHGLAALDFDLQTLQQLFKIRQTEFNNLIERLTKNNKIERSVSKESSCSIL